MIGTTSMSKKLLFNDFDIKDLFHPALLAHVLSWLAFVVAIFMGHAKGDNKGKPGSDTCRECWVEQTL